MMMPSHLQHWLSLPDDTRLNIFTSTARSIGLPVNAVEKDWWVVATLGFIFKTECADHLVFKGGTSLSKSWNLIQRFSEDIDLAINRAYLGFEGELSKQQIKKLRKASYQFITETFAPELQELFNRAGFRQVEIKCAEAVNHDQDPLIIELYYPKLTEKESYLKPGVLVELGSRSLIEPFTICNVKSLVSEQFGDRRFADVPVGIPSVNPERTFLEKIFLLHEEFQRPIEKVRVNRLSRHLYDIEKLSASPFADLALNSPDLYQSIVRHRQVYTPVSGVDYLFHQPASINFLPPTNVVNQWEADYNAMRESMIHEESSLSFNELIIRLTQLQDRIHQLSL